jgi:hypothetical protein
LHYIEICCNYIEICCITFQDHEKCRDYLSKITTTVKGRLPAYLPHLQYLIQRSSYDKLSIISSDVILMAYAHFSVTPEQVKIFNLTP